MVLLCKYSSGGLRHPFHTVFARIEAKKIRLPTTAPQQRSGRVNRRPLPQTHMGVCHARKPHPGLLSPRQVDAPVPDAGLVARWEQGQISLQRAIADHRVVPGRDSHVRTTEKEMLLRQESQMFPALLFFPVMSRLKLQPRWLDSRGARIEGRGLSRQTDRLLPSANPKKRIHVTSCCGKYLFRSIRRPNKMFSLRVPDWIHGSWEA